jgi:hypothetical protein
MSGITLKGTTELLSQRIACRVTALNFSNVGLGSQPPWQPVLGLPHLRDEVVSAGHVESAAEDLTRQAHSRVVQIAEDYVLSPTAEHLYVTDLCKAAGVSERTLQYAFKEVMGMTAVAYLTRLRLHQVRHAL